MGNGILHTFETVQTRCRSAEVKKQGSLEDVCLECKKGAAKAAPSLRAAILLLLVIVDHEMGI